MSVLVFVQASNGKIKKAGLEGVSYAKNRSEERRVGKECRL